MKFFALIFLISGSVVAATDAEVEALKKRIEALETQQEQILMNTIEPKNSVGSFLNDNLTLGGFFDGGYNFISGPDTDTQFVNNSNSLGINIAAELGSKYRFVAQFIHILQNPLLNEDNNPDGASVGLPKERHYESYEPFSVLSQGYVEYNLSRMFNIQGGLGYIPFGFALQLREPVFYVRRFGPQFIRQETELIPNLWSGIHIYGSKAINSREYGYNIYTFTPPQKSHLAGIGARTWMSMDDDKLVTGLSAQVAKNEDEAYQTVGADVRFDFHPFQIRAEFAELIQKDIENSWSAYFEPGFWVYNEEVLFYVFGDYHYGANNRTGRGSVKIDDPIQKWEYGMGLNWLPTSFTRIRTGITYNDYVGYRSTIKSRNRDYVGVDMSVGVAF